MVLYDILIFLLTSAMVLVVYPSSQLDRFTLETAAVFASICFCCLFLLRIVLKVYSQIWRYAGPQEYIRLLTTDAAAAVFFTTGGAADGGAGEYRRRVYVQRAAHRV